MILHDLLERNASRVLVVYAYPSRITQLVSSINRVEVKGRIVFIFPECTPTSFLRRGQANMVGSIKIDFDDIPDPLFPKFIRQVTPWTLPHDPWLKANWEGIFSCSYDSNSSKPSCYDYKGIFEAPGFPSISTIAKRYIDLVYVIATALHDYISEKCPDAAGNKMALRQCVKPHEINGFINKVSVERPGRRIRFNEEQETAHAYRHVFNQIQHNSRDDTYTNIPVAKYVMEEDRVEISPDDMAWSPHIPIGSNGYPVSVCSAPCQVGEIYIQGDKISCWECYRCREFEIVSPDLTSCQACGLLTWPDQDTFSKCVLIPVSYLKYTDSYGILLLSGTGVGLLATVLSVLVVIKGWNRRVIKGANRQLIIIILIGIGLAVGNMPMFVARPETWTCYTTALVFAMSFTLIYGPMVVKTIRVYRIFRASAKLQTDIKFINDQSQLVFTGIIFMIQVNDQFTWICS